MNDTLRYFHHEPIHRQYHHNELTFSLIYAFTENFMLPLSHDEVVHGKGALLSQMPGDMWQKFANLRLLYCYMWTHPGKKLLFMGGEIGMWNEWNHDRRRRMVVVRFRYPPRHPTMRRRSEQLGDRKSCAASRRFHWRRIRVGRLHERRRQHPGLSPQIGRRRPADAGVLQFHPGRASQDYRVGVPAGGFWREIFNSDSSIYGGSNVGTHPGAEASGAGHHGRPDSLVIDLPPLGVSVFRHEGIARPRVL